MGYTQGHKGHHTNHDESTLVSLALLEPSVGVISRYYITKIRDDAVVLVQ
jgi:hypothetical protein